MTDHSSDERAQPEKAARVIQSQAERLEKHARTVEAVLTEIGDRHSMKVMLRRAQKVYPWTTLHDVRSFVIKELKSRSPPEDPRPLSERGFLIYIKRQPDDVPLEW